MNVLLSAAAPSMELAANCPWASLPHASIHFCEENVCAWVTQPANAYSSLGFSLVGLALLLHTRATQARSLALFGPAAIAIGLTSFAYHASFSFYGQVMDLGSMYCLSALLVVMNARRAGLVAPERVVPLYLALVAGSTLAVVLFKVVGPAIFGAHLVAVLELERRARARAPASYAGLLGSLAIFLFSFGVWNLDYHRIWCDPERHVIQGHAIWHVLNAVALIPLYRFYLQFEERRPSYSAAIASAA